MERRQAGTGERHHDASELPQCGFNKPSLYLSPSRVSRSPHELLCRLKSLRPIIHRVHIEYLGRPVIMLLASAYASNRISRKVFVETLNLFVRYSDPTSYTRIGMLKPEELVKLGIPLAVANMLPLESSTNDLWLLIGLFTGVIDVRDFDLLRNPSKKGQFLEDHFNMTYDGTEDVEGDLALGFANDYSPLAWTDSTYRDHAVQSQIRKGCAQLEQWYLAPLHFMLRLAEASLHARRLELIGPFEDNTEFREVFAKVFRIVEADLDDVDAFPYRFHETFTFDESDVVLQQPSPPSKPRPSSCIIA